MKKIVFLGMLSISLFLTACNGMSVVEEVFSETPDSQITQSEERKIEDVEITKNTSATTHSACHNRYLEMLYAILGDAYFEGRSVMRATGEHNGGEYIDGIYCEVYAVGIDTDEQFVTEDWVAVGAEGRVYQYDIAMDEWHAIGTESNHAININPETIANCIYMLNEVMTEEYSVEYYDSMMEMKKAIFADEKAAMDGVITALVPLDQEEPEGHLFDPLARVYYPVYNFQNKEALYEHLSHYFTQNYMETIALYLEESFVDFEQTLYLVRGGRGYGATTIDFDDTGSTLVNNRLIVDTLFFGTPDGKLRVEFANQAHQVKIDQVIPLQMYDTMGLEGVEHIALPDFIAFITDNHDNTERSEWTLLEETENVHYRVAYDAFKNMQSIDYQTHIPAYIDLVEQLGYEVIIDGHEGFYSLEKQIDDTLVTLFVYVMNASEGVVVEVKVSSPF